MSKMLQQISHSTEGASCCSSHTAHLEQKEGASSCCTPQPSCCHDHGSLSDSHSATRDATTKEATAKKERQFTIKLLVVVIFTAPLLLHMVSSASLLHNAYFQLLMSLPVFVIGLQHFGPSALRSLQRRSANMDVLVLLGVIASYCYSLVGLIFSLGPDYLFFETAAAIICFVLIGNALEKRAVQKTTTALKELRSLQPTQAKRWDKEEQTITELPLSEIALGESIVTSHGEKIAFDSTIIEGSVMIDESFLTGESTPIKKEVGDTVLAGSLIVLGNIKSSVTSLEKDSLLSQMIELVRNAQQRKPKIQRIGDQASAYFVPTVATIAFLTLTVSFFFLDISLAESMLRAIAVLVVACPCAMGLATPTAIMVGVGKAAKRGIVIKGGDTLERLADIETILFDKTGTLTSVGNIQIEKENTSLSQERIRDIIYSLEQHSNHPIARAFVQQFSEAQLLDLQDIEEKSGTGISAKDAQGKHYELRSSESPESDITLLEDGETIASIRFEEELHEEVPMMIRNLKQQNIQATIVSGDKDTKVEAISAQAGIDNFYSEQRPEEKLTFLEDLQSQKQIAFVGDGINDAAALAKAHVGISLSNATDVAIESADIVLLGGKVETIVEAIDISKLTVRTIKQNLFWAFFYNIFALPIAAAGFLNPMIAALTMAFSDVIVIGNSLRIHFRTSPQKPL